jgi:hypothetical protein
LSSGSGVGRNGVTVLPLSSSVTPSWAGVTGSGFGSSSTRTQPLSMRRLPSTAMGQNLYGDLVNRNFALCFDLTELSLLQLG